MAAINLRQITFKGERKYEVETVELVTAYGPLLAGIYTATAADVVSMEPINKFFADMPDIITKFVEQAQRQQEAQNSLVQAAPAGMSADEIGRTVNMKELLDAGQ